MTFRGLPSGDLSLRSVDAGWTIESPRVFGSSSDYVVWTAKPRIGVRLKVVDADTGAPVERARAVFLVELSFADGGTAREGQWVGRGNGEVSFVLGDGTLPPLGERVITRARFFGRVKSGEVEVDWEAKPLVDARGVRGVATQLVKIPLQAAKAKAAKEGKVPTRRVPLAVRYLDGAPFSGGLFVRWRSKRPSGRMLEGKARLPGRVDGRYSIELPVGDVRIVAQERGASGSLGPWVGVVRVIDGENLGAQVALPHGATATIVRPATWEGAWMVHASWRMRPSDAWQGSWNYGTSEKTLVLNALRAAEWRFRLRLSSEDEAAPIVRRVLLRSGAKAIVDR